MSTNVSPESIAALRQEVQCSTPAKALRKVAQLFGLRRTDLAFVAAELFENILTPEVQAIWQWDLDLKGSGHTDEELNQLLSHLVPLASE